MGTPHNRANKGDIAPGVLMPGDPLRAKYVAENFLENPVLFNDVRGMLGYTGTYKGHRVSVMGSGMGIPSISIYANELYMFYDVEKIIRIGTCGCHDEDMNVGSVFIAQSASTNSNINHRIFQGDYAACADFGMLYNAFNAARELGKNVRVGNVLSSDTFYGENPDEWKLWHKYGVKNVEMESNGLYTAAAKHGKKALGLFTVSDHMLHKEQNMTPEEREKSLNDMIVIALETIIKEDI